MTNKKAIVLSAPSDLVVLRGSSYVSPYPNLFFYTTGSSPTAGDTHQMVGFRVVVRRRCLEDEK